MMASEETTTKTKYLKIKTCNIKKQENNKPLII